MTTASQDIEQMHAQKKPYLKRDTTIGDLAVFVVDGQYVRNHIDIEFTNFGQHYRFPFIPKNELWLDREQSPGESGYFIEHMLIEHKLMSNGMNYADAVTEASAAEKISRMRTEQKKRGFSEIETMEQREKLLGEIQKQLLHTYSSPKLKVWVVDGELIRDFFYIDFTQGGHEYVYAFVPQGEVWLDDDLVPVEREYVLLHELHERYLMAQGLSYPDAHESSSKLELERRLDSSLLASDIEREKELNQKV